MKIKIILIIIMFCLISFRISEAENSNLFEIKAIPIKNILILGEPIIIHGSVKYLGTKPLFLSPYIKDWIEIEGKCEGGKYWHFDEDILVNFKKKKEISPGWELKKVEYITWCVKIPKKIRVRYHFSFEPPLDKEVPSEIWQGHIISEWQEIDIIYPTGIDAEAFRAILGSNPTSQEINEWIAKKGNQILEKYPKSIYAGWALAGGKDCCEKAFEPEDFKRAKIESLPEPAQRRIKETYNGMPGWDLKQIEKYNAFINARPEFALADKFKYTTAYYRTDRGEYNEAAAILEELINNKSTDELLRKNCVKFLDTIKELQKQTN